MPNEHYDLFLDESGNFQDRNNPRCSVVGGVFAQAGLLTNALSEQILRETHQEVDLDFPQDGTVHSTEISSELFPSFALTLLKHLKSHQIQPVIFENEERAEIVNPDITYIHLLAEGVARFFTSTSSFGTTTTLNVIAARRMGTDGKNQDYLKRIPEKEYLPRIQERLDLAFLYFGMKEHKKKWMLNSFTLDSARTDYRLMIADCICHAWYTRHTKFNEEERQVLEGELDGYHFAFLEHNALRSIKRHKHEGAFGNALFHALSELINKPTSARAEQLHLKLRREVKQIVGLLAEMPTLVLREHLHRLLGQIECFIGQNRSYATSEKLLQEVSTQVLVPLQDLLQDKDGGIVDLIQLLVASERLAIANHQGHVATVDHVLVTGEKFATKLASRLEHIDAILSYLNRRAVYLNNAYDFQGSIHLIDSLIRFYEEILTLYPVVLPETFPAELKSKTLGKLYGSKLQALTMAGRKDPNLYDQARETSDKAFREFSSREDLQRQHLYRCQLELAMGNVQEAWKHLVLGAVDADETISPHELASDLRADRDGRRAYVLAHYCKMMAALSLQPNCSLPDFGLELGQAWEQNDLDNHSYLLSNPQGHPAEIIYWSLGTYDLLNNRIRRGLERQKKAVEICFQDQDSLTMHTIGLGILVEQAAILLRLEHKEHEEALKRALYRVQRFLETPGLPKSIKTYFGHWPRVIQAVNSKRDPTHGADKLFSLVREVPY